MVTFIKSTYESKNAPESHAWVGYIFKEIRVPVTPATEDRPASKETKIAHMLIPITFHGRTEEAILENMENFIVREKMVENHTFHENERKKAARAAEKANQSGTKYVPKPAEFDAHGVKIDRRKNPSAETLAKRAAGRARAAAERRAAKSVSANG